MLILRKVIENVATNVFGGTLSLAQSMPPDVIF